MWLVAVATVAFLLLLFWLFEGWRNDVPESAIWFGVLGMISFTLIPFYWCWGAPGRELSGRTPTKPGRTSAESARVGLAQVSWGNLAMVPVVAAGLLLFGSSRGDILAGWNRLWLVGAGLLVVLAGVQAFRKWRTSR